MWARDFEDTVKADLRWRAVGTVLLVDDEPAVLSITAKLLQRFGLTVISAKNGVEAVERFRVHQGEICCVLLDVNMPRMGGFEAFGRIRGIDPNVPVILSSGYGEKVCLDGLAGRGPSEFLTKPYNLASLQEVLMSVWDG